MHEAGRGWARPGGINLRAIPALGERFGCPAGWVMDDEQSTLTLAAVALCPRVVISPGSLGAESQRRLVDETRAVRRALGSGGKSLHEIDWTPRDSQYRSIVAGVDIPRGGILRPEMLTTAPPGIGLKPRLLPSLVGRRAAVDIARGTLITLVMVE